MTPGRPVGRRSVPGPYRWRAGPADGFAVGKALVAEAPALGLPCFAAGAIAPVEVRVSGPALLPYSFVAIGRTANTEGVTMETPNEMRTKIVGKATGDADFRARLLRDPKAAIGAELGVGIPSSMTIEVHEEDASTAHLVLPPKDRLDEDALRRAHGGFSSAPESMNVLNW